MIALPLLIEPEQLAPHLSNSNLLVIDLSKAETYAAGHVPGAIHLNASQLLRGHGQIPNKCPDEQQLSSLFSALGLHPDLHIVVYDDEMGPWAGRMIWTLHIVGHQRCSVLNGHLKGWIEAGLPLELQPNQPQPRPYTAEIDRSLIASKEEILASLGDPEQVIWDARSGQEYRGEKVVNAQKGGHIPGARHLEWTDCLSSRDPARLKEPAQLAALLASQGIDADKQVITHCQTHRRSGLTYLAGKVLGYRNLKCYDGSWFEWGNDPVTPVER